MVILNITNDGNILERIPEESVRILKICRQVLGNIELSIFLFDGTTIIFDSLDLVKQHKWLTQCK